MLTLLSQLVIDAGPLIALLYAKDPQHAECRSGFEQLTQANVRVYIPIPILFKVQAGRGVKINSIYYWSNSFRDPQIENTSVQIRYDPFNIGIAYAFVRGQWVECISQYYAELQGRSEKELKLASAELRKRSSNHGRQSQVSAKNLAEFLASVEAQEALLEQRSYDAEASEVFRVIEGGKATTSCNEQPKVIQVPFENTDTQVAEDQAIVPETLVVYEEF